jgi:hypothetical protein
MDKIKASTITLLDDLSGTDQPLDAICTWYAQGLFVLKILYLMQKEGTLQIYRLENGLNHYIQPWEIQQWLQDLDNHCLDPRQLSGYFVELTTRGINLIS